MFYIFIWSVIIGEAAFVLLVLALAVNGRVFAEKRIMCAAFTASFGIAGLAVSEIFKPVPSLVLVVSTFFGVLAMGLSLIFLELLRKRYGVQSKSDEEV